MPTIVTHSIGTASRDYSTMQAWEDACPANLVTADQVWKGECYKDTEFTAALSVAGTTTDSTHYLWLTVAAGQALADNVANALDYNATKGAAWRVTGSYVTMYTCSVQYTRLERLQLYYDSTYSSNYYPPVTTAGNDFVTGILYKTRRTAASNIELTDLSMIVNSVLIDASTSSAGGAGLVRIGVSAQARNCTFYRGADLTASSHAVSFRYPSSPTIRNCFFVGAFTNLLASSPTMSAASGYNATTLASVPFGSNNVAGLTASNEVVGSTSSAIDARSKTGNHLAAGARDATYTADKDFAGQARSLTVPQIGAWEFQSGGGGTDTPVNPAAGSLALSGYAPTIARTANQAISPAVGSVSISGYAPSVAQSSSVAINPGAGSFAITGYTPIISQPQALTLGAGLLAIAGYAPSVTQGITTNIVPSAGALTLTGYTPNVAQSANNSIAPSVGTIAITGYAPALAQTANQSIAAGVGLIALTGYAPSIVQQSASPSLLPGAGVLSIIGFAPEVTQSGMAAAPNYSPAKRRYIVRKDGQLLVFTDPELAKAVLHEDDEPEPVKQQPAKKQKKAAPKPIPASVPPEQVVDLAQVKALADKHQAEAEYKQLMAKQQYEKILALLERLQDEEEDDWLLMAAA